MERCIAAAHNKAMRAAWLSWQESAKAQRAIFNVRHKSHLPLAFSVLKIQDLCVILNARVLGCRLKCKLKCQIADYYVVSAYVSQFEILK